MSMKMPLPSAGFEPAPQGTHLATCYEVIDFGTQHDVYNGEEKEQRKIWIGWELQAELMEDGQPYVTGKEYTLSSGNKSNLRKDLESWRGCPFNDEDFGPGGKFSIENLIGATCMLGIQHQPKQSDPTKTRVVVASVLMPPKSSKRRAEHVNDGRFLNLTDEDFDPVLFNSLGDWMKNKIRKSPEFAALAYAGHPDNHNQEISNADQPFSDGSDDPDIPF